MRPWPGAVGARWPGPSNYHNAATLRTLLWADMWAVFGDILQYRDGQLFYHFNIYTLFSTHWKKFKVVCNGAISRYFQVEINSRHFCTTSSNIGYMSGYGGPGSCSRAQQWEVGRKTRKKATHNVLSLSFPFLALVPTNYLCIILWLHFCCHFVTADHLLRKRVFSLFLDFFR